MSDAMIPISINADSDLTGTTPPHSSVTLSTAYSSQPDQITHSLEFRIYCVSSRPGWRRQSQILSRNASFVFKGHGLDLFGAASS